MAGLVEEIQRDALDPNSSVSTLLRKVKLAAAKLQLPAIEEWVENELNGYKGEVPDYRKLTGTPKAFNPCNGWIPIMGGPNEMEVISRIHAGQSIASIEDLLSNKDAKNLQVPLDVELVHLLNKDSDVQLGQMVNFIGRGAIVAIIDTVRTKVLDWAIELERLGIKGEGMSFNPEEKVAAHTNPGIAIGTVGTLVGVVGSNNQVRDIVGRDLNLSQVRDIATQLDSNHSTLVSAGANDGALRTAVSGLLVEVEKPAPDNGVIRGFLQDTRAALAGAAGNLLATGALSVIGTILS
ncbi:hypothetical protein HJB99_12310 [Rhizobium sp. NLR17b]|uniref:AbiTii domain-containing protein n=1 Tax=Rhizobium sp. NLR17b TaxID=2731114 RepID=UPI001C82AAD8|nr:hypothetical protein [Rhizobium sp. NLR17b]MBX5269458.1 hypothetical protein [Rhizobium sp. NLR17b]